MKVDEFRLKDEDLDDEDFDGDIVGDSWEESGGGNDDESGDIEGDEELS